MHIFVKLLYSIIFHMSNKFQTNTAFLLSFRRFADLNDANSSFTLGTKTMTKAREGSDQDRHAISNSLLATKTLTETKENRDSDRSQMGYHVIPRS